jgi:hypothetical protein
MRIIILGVLILVSLGALLAASFLMSRVARQSAKVRQLTALLLFLLILPAPVEFLTGYTLATPYAGVVTPLVSMVAYVLELLLLWHWKNSKWNWNRLAAALGLGAPMFYLTVNFTGLALVFSVFLGANGFRPVAAGRLSSNLSYRVVTDHNLYGNTAYYAYQVYRNPAWFPLVEKRVARGPLECEDTQTDLGTGDFKLALHPPVEKAAIYVACIYRGAQSPPMKIDIFE